MWSWVIHTSPVLKHVFTCEFPMGQIIFTRDFFRNGLEGSRSNWREPLDAQREHAEGFSLGFKLRTFFLQGIVVIKSTAVQTCEKNK